MSLREELEKALHGDFEDAKLKSYRFLRDHGQALLEAVADTERYRQLLSMLDPDEVPGGITLYYALDKDVDQLVYSDEELNEILDTARSKTVDGGGVLEGIQKHRGNPENPPST